MALGYRYIFGEEFVGGHKGVIKILQRTKNNHGYLMSLGEKDIDMLMLKVVKQI